jgi:hypothetical protein
MTGIASRNNGAWAPPHASWSERLLAFVEASHARGAGVLLALSLACFLPGFVSLQPMDRDEPRFAQATKQMLESGDYVSIRFQGEARNKKPVGIHWLQAASVLAAEQLGLAQARTTIAVYRLPSLLGAIATVLLTYWAALAFGARREAFLAAAFMAGSVILMVEARLAKTDAVLTACSVAAMGALARAYLGRGAGRLAPRLIAIFWLAVATGILVKGPMVPMFAGLAAAVLAVRERSARWLWALRPALGAAVVAILVLPWFAAIGWKTGGAFFAQAVGDDMLGKVASGQQKHFAPPGAYLLVFFATFWPAAILAALAVPFAWARRRDDAVAFCLAWIVPSWLVFEAVPTKLPHYVLPLLAAVSILTVMALARREIGPHWPGARLAALLVPAIPTAIAVLIVAGAWRLDGVVPGVALPVLLAAIAAAIAAWRSFGRGEVTRAALTAVAAAAMLSVGVFGLAAPVLASLKLSPRLAAEAAAIGCADPNFATLGYREPSLVFLLGTDLVMVENARDAVAHLRGGGCRVLFVERRFAEAFDAEVARAGAAPVLRARVSGFNINGGRPAEIAVYTAGR